MHFQVDGRRYECPEIALVAWRQAGARNAGREPTAESFALWWHEQQLLQEAAERQRAALRPFTDPRLPDKATARDRGPFGAKYPKVHPPHRAAVLAMRAEDAAPGFAARTHKVLANRTRTRYWYVCAVADGFTLDYATTTSRRVADGWVAAVAGESSPPA
jgi:hypothetical protein